MTRDIPSIQYGSQKDFKHLYFSDPNASLTLPVTLQAGYGLLESGQALAINLSNLTTGNKGKYVPYNLTTFDGTEVSPGRAYLVANTGTTATTCNVSIEDSYKFAVGDDLIINDNTTAAENLGAITVIDRTTYQTYAVITFTAAIGGTAFTTARFAYVAVEAGDNTNNYSDCVGILEKPVDTGTGSTAEGAIGTMIISNAVLYLGMCAGIDTASKADISATAYGNFLAIK